VLGIFVKLLVISQLDFRYVYPCQKN